MSLPHELVFTRLKSSELHGIGVFAIAPIPAGEYLFEPDDDELVFVDQAAIRRLPQELQQLYDDFCPLSADKFACPKSFNRLTPAWYLNHSDTPNVAADKDIRFYALRDISVGEELTSDYRTYTEVSDSRLA